MKINISNKKPTIIFWPGARMDEIGKKLLSTNSGVSYSKLKKVNITRSDWLSLAKAASDISKEKFIIDNSKRSFKQIYKEVKKLKEEFKRDVDVVIIGHSSKL